MPLKANRSRALIPGRELAFRFEDCWAKTTESGHPGICVADHCLAVGYVAACLIEGLPARLMPAFCRHCAATLAALHDVGKVAPGFQAKCAAWCLRYGLTATDTQGQETDHAAIGQMAVQEWLGGAESAVRYWAVVIGAHHGSVKDDILVAARRGGGAAWARERTRLRDRLCREFGDLPTESPPMRGLGRPGPWLWYVAGLTTLADWIGSDERFFDPARPLSLDATRQRASHAVDSIGLKPVAVAPGLAFADIFAFTANSLQTALVKAAARPGLYIVEGPMGCGKTEAALAAAYGLIASGSAQGIYFALPTQTCSNRIHLRVRAFLEKIGVTEGARLIHSGAWLQDREPVISNRQGGMSDGAWRDEGRDWFSSPKRAILAPFGVGTVDQALLGVVAAKHFALRLYGLAGKVVVLDEVHSYDLYTGTLIDHLIRQLRELGATVIVLSATLTAARRRQLLGLAEPTDLREDYPLISMARETSEGADSRDVSEVPVGHDSPAKSVRVQFVSAEGLEEACLAKAREGACVLWIRNTVDAAQKTYLRLKGENQVGGPEIALLHARFPVFRRDDIENEWMGRLGRDELHAQRPRNGCVLVSTQIAEQSVDIDADLLVTDLAPSDMLLQRCGRLWRHPRGCVRPGCDAPEIWIQQPCLSLTNDEIHESDRKTLKAAFGKSSRVYAPYVLVRTLDVWRRRGNVTLPTDIRPLLESTYADLPMGQEPSGWCELRQELEEQRQRLESMALSNLNVWQVALKDDEGVQTRWSDQPAAYVLPMTRVVQYDPRSRVRFELPSGDDCDIRPDRFGRRFVFDIAKAIHRNLIRVPRWCVEDLLDSTPEWLREYVCQDVVACEIADGRLLSVPDGKDSGLEYRHDLGLVVNPEPRRMAPGRWGAEEDDNEPCD